MADLSIIVPVYNTASYVAECLNSILNQDRAGLSIEVIIVNDGSKDNSMEIINGMVMGRSDVRVISQKNMGLSMARNNGLDAAVSEWVWFVDSDDWIASDSFAILKSYLKPEKRLDAVLFSSKIAIDNEVLYENDQRRYDGRVDTGLNLLRDGIVATGVPYTIYRRDFLSQHGLKMIPGIYHEDSEFTPRAFHNIQSAIVLKNVLYYRRVNPDSITHTIGLKHKQDNLFVAKSIMQYAKDNVSREDWSIFAFLVGRSINNCLFNVQKIKPEYRQQLSRNLALAKDVFQFMRLSSKRKHRIEGRLFFLLPNHVIGLYTAVEAIHGKLRAINSKQKTSSF